MLSYIFGSNTFIIQTAITEAIKPHGSGEVIRIDGEDMQPAALPEIFHGQTLFSQHRLVIIKNANADTKTWQALEDWIARIPSGTHIMITALQPDKRTRTHKALLAAGQVIEANELNEKQAVDWLIAAAEVVQKDLPTQAAKLVVERVGTDQWQLSSALDKLLLAGSFDEATIKNSIDAVPQANAFAVLDAMLTKRPEVLSELLGILKTSEDPYRFFGLLAQQVFQFTLVSEGQHKSAEDIAKEIGAHPYPIKKLQLAARRAGTPKAARMTQELIHLDSQLKRTSSDQWRLIEKALHKMMQ